MFFDFPKIGTPMPDMLGDPSAIPCLNILRSYYDGLRHEGTLPHRDQIEPRALGGVLENSFLVERIASGIGRFRLAGMAVQDTMGMDARNMPLSILFEPVARAQLTQVLEQVFTSPTMLDLTLEAERMIGRPHLAARMILLPLRDAKGGYHQVIGALALSGTIGRAPRRFGITRMRSERFDAPPVAMPANVRRLSLSHTLPDFAAADLAAADFIAQNVKAVATPPRGKPALRLVHSRD